ncbi:unnamed protein product, partial [Prorocentrum cordatum]
MCGRQVTLYKPKGGEQDDHANDIVELDSKSDKATKGTGKGKGGAGKGGTQPDQATPPASRLQLLQQTISTASAPLLLKLLQDELAKVQAASTPTQSPEEALRLAAGAWRDATLRHDQAVNAVVKAQENLTKAQQRERAAALDLAKAEQAWQIAAHGLASDMGIAPKEKDILFQVQIAEEFFAGGLEGLDIEQQDLEAVMEGKRSEAQRWQVRMKELRQKVYERFAKKRRAVDE